MLHSGLLSPLRCCCGYLQAGQSRRHPTHASSDHGFKRLCTNQSASGRISLRIWHYCNSHSANSADLSKELCTGLTTVSPEQLICFSRLIKPLNQPNTKLRWPETSYKHGSTQVSISFSHTAPTGLSLDKVEDTLQTCCCPIMSNLSKARRNNSSILQTFLARHSRGTPTSWLQHTGDSSLTGGFDRLPCLRPGKGGPPSGRR